MDDETDKRKKIIQQKYAMQYAKKYIKYTI